MRPLHRPMFRYGGPIKEGVMSGIREPRANGGAVPGTRVPGYSTPAGYNRFDYPSGGAPVRVGAYDGGRIGLVGSPVFPKDASGRAHHADYWKNLWSAGKPILKSWVTPWKKPKKVVKAVDKITKNKQLTLPGMEGTGVGSSAAGQTFIKNLKDFSVPYASKLKGWGTKAKDLVVKYPKTTIAGGVGLTSDPARSVYSNLGGMGRWTAEALLPGWAERKFLPWRGTKLGKDGQTTTPFHPSQGNVKEEIEEKIIEPEKSDAEIRKEQIQKYRDIMDIKGMNKEAAYNSLIEASRLVNESGDFKGDMRSGKLINQMIQGASKAFDKPKATKDAIDTLILKGEIEKDLNKDKNAILDTYRMKQIENLDRAAAQDSLQGDIRTYVTKQGALPSGNMLANFARGRGWNITGVEDTTEVKKWMNNNDGKNEIDYLTWVMSEGEIGPGVYVINNRILEVDEQKKITPKF